MILTIVTAGLIAGTTGIALAGDIQQRKENQQDRTTPPESNGPRSRTLVTPDRSRIYKIVTAHV